MKERPCRIGTRKSQLATTQSGLVLKKLEALGVGCELVTIDSAGDRDRKTPLYEIEASGPGLFTKQLEEALLSDSIDLAVHSLKDLPTDQPPDLEIVCVLEREAAEDCLVVAKKAMDSSEKIGIARGARVGTSSLRREAQLKFVRPDLGISPIRGNVPTRVEAVRAGNVDAVVLACAGLNRLQLDLSGLAKIVLPLESFPSAPGQGALAIEARSSLRPEWREALNRLHHDLTFQAVTVERGILAQLHGGCSLPLGVTCTWSGKAVDLKAFLGRYHQGSSGRVWDSFHPFELIARNAEEAIDRTLRFFNREPSS